MKKSSYNLEEAEFEDLDELVKQTGCPDRTHFFREVIRSLKRIGRPFFISELNIPAQTTEPSATPE